MVGQWHSGRRFSAAYFLKLEAADKARLANTPFWAQSQGFLILLFICNSAVLARTFKLFLHLCLNFDSEFAVHFNWNLSWLQFRSAALPKILLKPCKFVSTPYFYQGPMNDQMIESSNDNGFGDVWSITCSCEIQGKKNKQFVTAQNSQSTKNFFDYLCEYGQYDKKWQFFCKARLRNPLFASSEYRRIRAES